MEDKSKQMYIVDTDHQRKKVMCGLSEWFFEPRVKKSRYRAGGVYWLWLTKGEKAALRRMGRSEEFLVRVVERRRVEGGVMVKVALVSEKVEGGLDALVVE